MMHTAFTKAVIKEQGAFGLELSEDAVERLALFYELVAENNPLLHLVAPAPPEEFAVRHVLESLTLLSHLPQNSVVADIGTGAGLPAIPCMLVRDDISVLLIESKLKKARYLEDAVARLGLSGRARVYAKQFEEVRGVDFDVVTCRALDRFTEKLPRMLKWAQRRPLLLFGGPALGDELKRRNAAFDTELMPMSERRYLYLVGGGR